jgi:Family of unknown function (DUF6496)
VPQLFAVASPLLSLLWACRSLYDELHKDAAMAKYGKKAGEKVERAMRERKRGTLRSGSSGRKVKSREQAIAIGLSEARREGAKVPQPRSRERGGAPMKKTRPPGDEPPDANRKQPGRGDDDGAPETPTDEPPPVPVRDPPSDDRPRPPLTVKNAS